MISLICGIKGNRYKWTLQNGNRLIDIESNIMVTKEGRWGKDKLVVWDCCCWVTSVVSNSVRPHRRQPTRLPHPWDSPGKNTGVGCHFLLQSLGLVDINCCCSVTKSCPTLCNPMNYHMLGFPVGHCLLEFDQIHWVSVAIQPSHLLLLPLWPSWSRICPQCGRPGFDSWVGKIPWRRE